MGRPKLVLRREERELPAERPAKVALVETILNLGGVRRLVIEAGKPIVFERYVEADETGDPPPELPPEDLLYGARNADIFDFEKVRKTWAGPLEMLFDMFNHLSAERKRARAFLVKNPATFRTWLGQGTNTGQVFGVEVIAHPGMPDEACLLVANRLDEQDASVVASSIKFELNRHYFTAPKGKKT